MQQGHQISTISMKSMLAPNNAMNIRDALRQATICLTQTKGEVEEMEMSGEQREEGEWRSSTPQRPSHTHTHTDTEVKNIHISKRLLS